MAILCLGNSSLRIEGYGFIGELALDGSSTRPAEPSVRGDGGRCRQERKRRQRTDYLSARDGQWARWCSYAAGRLSRLP
jgi:hypothetical protein